nr:MAG TPA: hypothetical protein [Caudoviricetes sp.]
MLQIVINIPFSRGRGHGDDFVDVNKTMFKSSTISVITP